MYHTHKISSTTTSILTLTSSTVCCQRFVVYLDSIAINWENLQSLSHKLWLWEQVVCSFKIQDVSHNHFIPMASRQPKPQPYISMANGVTCYSSSKIMELLLCSLAILSVQLKLSPISANVISDGTIQVPALVRWALSVWNCHPIVLN